VKRNERKNQREKENMKQEGKGRKETERERRVNRGRAELISSGQRPSQPPK
jgi:hypothetical protein